MFIRMVVLDMNKCSVTSFKDMFEALLHGLHYVKSHK